MATSRLSGLVHFVNGAPIAQDCPSDCEEILLGMGCFWGVERKFWQIPGVVVTSVGYAGGHANHPSYEAVCTGNTGHAEVVRVIYDPSQITIDALLQVFWESHDPTQGMRQGNDIGTQYRSAIYCTTEAQQLAAEASAVQFQSALASAGHGTITTEISGAKAYFIAEDYHQQYLAKNPNGYCGLKGTGVVCVL